MTKYFPIKTETACQLKWTWSTIYLYEGNTNSCHRVDKSSIIDDFGSFHNTPKKLADRKLMLGGHWPSGGCDYCKKIEDVGGSSDRMMHLKIPNLSPEELEIDPTAISVTPRIVEVYFDNVCNMSCIYCTDKYSSKIQQENAKFGSFNFNGVVIENAAKKNNKFTELTESFWQWIDKNYSSLRRLHILGGEPFYQKQFDVCLDFLDSHFNKDLEFNIVSNLMIDHEKFKTQIYKIKDIVRKQKIKRLEITASIDCWGLEQEYIRYGLDLKQWQQNFEFLVQEKWVTLNINQTVSVLSIPTTQALIEYINIHRRHRPIGQYFMSVVSPSYLNPDILGNVFESHFQQILPTMPDLISKDYMTGIRKQIANSTRNTSEIAKLIVYLTELDRRRNTNWRTTFPWLEQEVKDVV
jgi:organic radical activating enzyme